MAKSDDNDKQFTVTFKLPSPQFQPFKELMIVNGINLEQQLIFLENEIQGLDEKTPLTERENMVNYVSMLRAQLLALKTLFLAMHDAEESKVSKIII